MKAWFHALWEGIRKNSRIKDIIEHIGIYGYDKETREYTTDGIPDGKLTKITKEYQRGKTFWDWMQLLIIPFVLALATIWLNFTQAQTSLQNSQKQHFTDTQLALDKQRQEALVAYQKDISDLLLTHQLRSSKKGDDVRSVARARTLSTLQILDPSRKGLLIQFIQEAGLIATESWVISLSGADLREVELSASSISKANLQGSENSAQAPLQGNDSNAPPGSNSNASNASNAPPGNSSNAPPQKGNSQKSNLFIPNLRNANFSGADLSEAKLISTNLSGAGFLATKLIGANFSGATLTNAILVEADFSFANLTNADLSAATLYRADLREANLSNTNLKEADLSYVNLSKANLSGANLRYAIITQEQLKQAKSLKGTIMPDGTIHH